MDHNSGQDYARRDITLICFMKIFRSICAISSAELCFHSLKTKNHQHRYRDRQDWRYHGLPVLEASEENHPTKIILLFNTI
jgi:hypothetical protein